MKNLKINLFVAMAAMALSACQKDEVKPTYGGDNALPTEMATVQFAMQAPTLREGLNTRSIQTYEPANFRVLAFRHNGTDFVYTTDVKFNNDLKYENNVFTGTAQLPVGVYKFIPAYGLPKTSDDNVTLSALKGNTKLDDTITVTHKDVLPAIFLREDANIPMDTLGMESGAKNSVTAKIKRAVARLDILFVRGTKGKDGNFTEKPGDDVFGGRELDSIIVSVNNITSSAQLMDGKGIYTDKMNTVYSVVLRNMVKSSGSLENPSTIGAIGYDFDNVSETHIIQGGAYAYGPNLFPFEKEGNTTTLNLRVRSKADTNGHVYVRNITVPKIQLMRNKVTLVRIYTQNNDFFNTRLDFNVTVEEAWEGSYNATGEAS